MFHPLVFSVPILAYSYVFVPHLLEIFPRHKAKTTLIVITISYFIHMSICPIPSLACFRWHMYDQVKT